MVNPQAHPQAITFGFHSGFAIVVADALRRRSLQCDFEIVSDDELRMLAQFIGDVFQGV
jgi:hypothetical protein